MKDLTPEERAKVEERAAAMIEEELTLRSCVKQNA
jgi:hypothetical protein